MHCIQIFNFLKININFIYLLQHFLKMFYQVSKYKYYYHSKNLSNFVKIQFVAYVKFTKIFKFFTRTFKI